MEGRGGAKRGVGGVVGPPQTEGSHLEELPVHDEAAKKAALEAVAHVKAAAAAAGTAVAALVTIAANSGCWCDLHLSTYKLWVLQALTQQEWD